MAPLMDKYSVQAIAKIVKQLGSASSILSKAEPRLWNEDSPTHAAA
jgi:hypothetical protein